MLRLRPLRGADEAATYASAYQQITGYQVDPNFLARTTAYGVFNRHELRAGFIANTEPPFRYLERLPDAARDRVTSELDVDGLVELCCAWMDPELRSGPWSFVFWSWMLREASRMGKPLALFGTEVPGLHRLYDSGRPVVVYEGPVCVDGQFKDGWVYKTPVARRWTYLALVMWHKAVRPARKHVIAPLRATAFPRPIGQTLDDAARRVP